MAGSEKLLQKPTSPTVLPYRWKQEYNAKGQLETTIVDRNDPTVWAKYTAGTHPKLELSGKYPLGNVTDTAYIVMEYQGRDGFQPPFEDVKLYQYTSPTEVKPIFNVNATGVVCAERPHYFLGMPALGIPVRMEIEPRVYGDIINSTAQMFMVRNPSLESGLRALNPILIPQEPSTVMRLEVRGVTLQEVLDAPAPKFRACPAGRPDIIVERLP